MLQHRDFEQMSQAEIDEALRAISRLRLPVPLRRTRRYQPARRGPRVDFRASLRRALRPEGLTELRKREPRKPAAAARDPVRHLRARWPATRACSCISCTPSPTTATASTASPSARGSATSTRALRNKDVDVALQKASAQVEDWSGGTRIGQTLHEFNNKWSRRVLGQGAVVLLITDGLDREGAAGPRRGDGAAAQVLLRA